MLRWATELGRTEILHKVSLISQYQASTREGDMGDILHIFDFLDEKTRLTLYMNTDVPHLDYLLQNDPSEFMEYYRDAREEMPHNIPRPRGISVVTTAYIDTYHGESKVTRRLQSGYILFVNIAPVKRMSKQQKTVEMSEFSS